MKILPKPTCVYFWNMCTKNGGDGTTHKTFVVLNTQNVLNILDIMSISKGFIQNLNLSCLAQSCVHQINT